MKVALYYTRPFETGGIEKTMLARGKYLSENGFDVTFIYASYDSPIDMLEKWATVGNVKHLDICKDEVLDILIEGFRRLASKKSAVSLWPMDTITQSPGFRASRTAGHRSV